LISESVIKNIVSEKLGTEFFKIQPLTGGKDHFSYLLENKNAKKIVAKISSSTFYSDQVKKEFEILPIVAKNIQHKIPNPLFLITDHNPYNILLYEFIEGKTLQAANLNEKEKEELALDLSLILKNLHDLKFEISENYRKPGVHNWQRGDDEYYLKDTYEQIDKIKNVIDYPKAFFFLTTFSLINEHTKNFIHGDISLSNLLINEDNKLESIIDWGLCSIGSPACDLVMAYNYFENNSRNIFMNNFNYNEDFWSIVKFWVLWKASFELSNMENHETQEALDQIKIINQVIF